jgi:glycosyltransferase involved in cell wall biosynthesis
MPGKVSFVCTTYRRFRCVERIIEQFISQTYQNKQLIILNTDVENPLVLDHEVLSLELDIILINNSFDYQTGLEYTNRGQICRDAVSHADGDYFMLADDDDIYLPWHLDQAVDGIETLGKDAWKPAQSFFALPDKLILVQNTLEASVIVKMNRIKEIGFREDKTGYEGLSWYTRLRDEGQLWENNPNYVPSYCFNWSDPADMAGHKQSGNIDNPTNFEEHKLASNDVLHRPLNRCGRQVLETYYERYYNYLRENPQQFHPHYYTKFVLPHIQ